MGPTYGELGYNGITDAAGNIGAAPPVTPPVTSPEFMKDPIGWMMNNKVKTAGLGLGAYTLANMLGGGSMTKPKYLPNYTPPSAASYGLNAQLASNYAPQRRFAAGGNVNVGAGSVPTAGVAPADLTQNSGIQSLMRQYNVTPQQVQTGLNTLGIKTAADGGLMQNGPDQTDFMGGGAYPMSQQVTPHYATPSQMPTSAQAAMASYEPNTNPLTGEQTADNMASCGISSLGSYSDGGRMLKGPGDGMSDNIPATIGGKQPARLADGEFVVPADVVSHLGNGSTDAGAKRLYGMMDKIRKARTGKKKQAPAVKADKYLPA
jgi:hypothetical protein